MNVNKCQTLLGSFLVLACATFALPASAAPPEPQQDGDIQFGRSYQNDTSLPLYYLPAQIDDLNIEDEARVGPKNPPLPINHVDSEDPVIQNTSAPIQRMPATIMDFDGIGFPGVNCNCAPPDTNGEVGDTQYVQMVNEGLQVFDKATGASVMGPQDITSVWAGFGGVCENNGSGDPVVLYDQLANRWLISQFAGTGIPTDECIAISTTSDATGAYHRYAFHLGSNFFDYPHLGVWPDGYYMAMNIFNSSATAYLGPQAFAFDRTAMLAGVPGAVFVTPGITGGPGEDSFLPADLDGTDLPPAGAPNPFVEFPGSNSYRVFHFHADFANPGNSTFTLFDDPAAAGFSVLCPGTRSCVPQLQGTGGNKLDEIGDRLMFRLAYRNFGSHDSLVGNFTVSAGGVAGVRWFELRDVTLGPVDVFQESTYQPDSTWRWMGSTAMDSAGNLAVGFSASDATIHPQIRYAGRLAGDPANTLAQGEEHLFDGTGSQTGTGNRWGDYSALTVDPVDDCTFWYTSEYYATTGDFAWRTRIGNFKFAACGTPGFTLNATPQSASVCAGDPAQFTVDVGSVSGFDSPVTLAASGNPAGTTANFSPNPVPSLPGSSTLQIGNTAGAAAGLYPIQIDGSAAGADDDSTTANLAVFSVAPPAPGLTAPPNGASNQPLRPTFSWSGSNTETYTVEIATDSAFANIVFTQSVTGTSLVPNLDLGSNTQYYWRVLSANACGPGPASATFSFTTLPLPGDCSAGSTPQNIYDYGFEAGLSGWTLGSGSIGNTWADNATAHGGAHSWKANDPASISDQRFVSPSVALPTGQDPLTLQFWNKHDMEDASATACYDGGILEISTNGGSTWTQLGAPDLLTDPYNGPIDDGFDNPLANLEAWCGTQDWTRSIVDLSAFAGQNAQFRFRLGSDVSVNADGWYLDDVKVQACAGSGTTWTVTPDPVSNGTIAPSTPQIVNDGDTIGFTLTPDVGFEIDTVTGCGGALAGNVYTTAPVTADCTVTATFAATVVTWTVTPAATTNGTIAPSTPQVVNDGDTIGFTLTPDVGFEIDTVTGCGGTLAGNSYTTAPITADCTVVATFAATVSDSCDGDADEVFCDGFDGTGVRNAIAGIPDGPTSDRPGSQRPSRNTGNQTRPSIRAMVSAITNTRSG